MSICSEEAQNGLRAAGHMKSSVVTQKLILDVLKNNDEDMIISKIAKETKIHRLTASKYLAVLEAKGYVRHRTVGRAKLYSPALKIKEKHFVFKDLKEFFE
jgi:DNA-binding IclR family transcriptional regulator